MIAFLVSLRRLKDFQYVFYRLGLGAKVIRQSKVGPLNDPAGRKLHAKLEAGKRKATKSIEESLPSTRGGGNGNDNDNDDEDSDGEMESRTSAFTKKRAGPLTSSSQLKKKKK